MGKGDKRTKRGKLFSGSFGNSRPHKLKKTAGAGATATAAKPKPKKTTKKKATKK